MAELVKEGWYEDPANRHEYRWFSQGVPTDLVKDDGTTSRDSISLTDPAAYQSMQLAQEPDVGPLLHKDDAPPPKLELVNIGGVGSMGYAGVINTASVPVQAVPVARAGAGEILLVVLPILAELPVFALVGAGELPHIAWLAPALAALLIAAVGRWRRVRRARRHLRSATSRQGEQRT